SSARAGGGRTSAAVMASTIAAATIRPTMRRPRCMRACVPTARETRPEGERGRGVPVAGASPRAASRLLDWLEHFPISKRHCHPGISRLPSGLSRGQRNIRDPGRMDTGVQSWVLGPGSRADARGRDDSASGATGSVRSECALDAVGAAAELGLEVADVGHDLAVEVALAHAALRLDEAQVDVEAQDPFELLARAVGQLAAEQRAARFDQRADLADELGAGLAQLLHRRDLLLHRLHVLLGALGRLAGLRHLRPAEGKRHLRRRRPRQAGAQHEQRHDGKPSHGTLRQLQFSAERIAGVCPHLGGIITAALPAHYGLVVHRRPQKASAALRRGRSLRATDRCDAASPFPPYGPQRENQPLPPPLSALTSVVPSAAGLSATAMPADFMASTLSLALPLPPEMMAPAWPMRRPGGAVMPAMKPAIGFLRPFLASDLMKSAASSSAAPP